MFSRYGGFETINKNSLKSRYLYNNIVTLVLWVDLKLHSVGYRSGMCLVLVRQPERRPELGGLLQAAWQCILDSTKLNHRCLQLALLRLSTNYQRPFSCFFNLWASEAIQQFPDVFCLAGPFLFNVIWNTTSGYTVEICYLINARTSTKYNSMGRWTTFYFVL